MKFYIMIILAFFSFSSHGFACDKGGEFKVTIKRAAKQNDHCIDLVVKFPTKQGDMWPSSTTELSSDIGDGIGFGASLDVHFFDDSDGSRVALSNFCLSDKVLKSSKLMFEYTAPDPNGHISLCFEKYEINNLDELLAQSDKEATKSE